MLSESFGRLGTILEHFRDGVYREPLTVAAVATFAVGWLLPRLEKFRRDHPLIDLRLMTHNNKVDLAGEGLDFAIRFGHGAWHGTRAEPLFEAPLTPMCTPTIARRLATPRDLLGETLLRSYRNDEWRLWFEAAGVGDVTQPLRGPVLDSSLALATATAQGAGIALLPRSMFQQDLWAGQLVQPFAFQLSVGSYWLTQLQSKAISPAMAHFRNWLLRTVLAHRRRWLCQQYLGYRSLAPLTAGWLNDRNRPGDRMLGFHRRATGHAALPSSEGGGRDASADPAYLFNAPCRT